MASAAPAVELDAAGRAVRVSSPDRVVFPELPDRPGLTKREIVEYFLSVGDGILGALLHRPTTLERWPKGWWPEAVMATRADNRGDAFYQKRLPKGAPDWVETATIAFRADPAEVEVLHLVDALTGGPQRLAQAARPHHPYDHGDDDRDPERPGGHRRPRAPRRLQHEAHAQQHDGAQQDEPAPSGHRRLLRRPDPMACPVRSRSVLWRTPVT